VQVIGVPTQVPLEVQVSLYVQALPSLQACPVSGVTVQEGVPLQERVLHWSLVHVIVVPTQDPAPSQVAAYVQGLPGLHAPPAGYGWQSQTLSTALHTKCWHGPGHNGALPVQPAQVAVARNSTAPRTAIAIRTCIIRTSGPVQISKRRVRDLSTGGYRVNGLDIELSGPDIWPIG
jgi:hypothetical protein